MLSDKLKEKTGKPCAHDVPPEQLEFILPEIPQVSYNSSGEMGYYFFPNEISSSGVFRDGGEDVCINFT